MNRNDCRLCAYRGFVCDEHRTKVDDVLDSTLFQGAVLFPLMIAAIVVGLGLVGFVLTALGFHFAPSQP